MTRNISTDAEIDSVRLTQQISHPSSPSSGYESLYIISGSSHGGLFLKDSSGRQIGPFITGSSGGGAPTDAEYVTTASHASLSAEVIIPGLAGSADIQGAGGAGVAHEFDSGASPLTWSAAVDTENVNSTVLSCLYVQDNGAAETLGTYDWSPAGAFDIRCKISMGSEVDLSSNIVAVGILVGDSAMNNRCVISLEYTGASDRYQVSAYTYAGSYTQRGASQLNVGNAVYLRIVRDGSNNNSLYFSSDGVTWLLIATQALTYTAAKAGFRFIASSLTSSFACDWIRSDV